MQRHQGLARRQFITGTCAMTWAGALAFSTGALARPSLLPSRVFSFQTVIDLAHHIALKPYVAPLTALPPHLADMDYDGYRKIQFRHPNALWADSGLGFRVEFFHRGSLYKERIDLFEVDDGQVHPLSYSPELFQYDPPLAAPLPADTGFAGFRLIAEHGTALDEVVSFLGASYFRSPGPDHHYGLSARGLAIGTGSPQGEEFPLFRSFWIERPAKDDDFVRIHALLDSPSLSGAYSFDVVPGKATVIAVEAVLFPRRPIADVGIAPLTSMYLFGPIDRGHFDDFRDAVHDSDGLQVLTGTGQALWRPLINPPSLQESTFLDRHPRGFGLMQRETAFAAYDDAEARYDKRPSVWVKPDGDWPNELNEGAVHLFELPSNSEGNDNIVVFWRPSDPLRPGKSYTFRYGLSWGRPDIAPLPPVHIVQTRTGQGLGATGRQFVIDIARPAGLNLTPVLTASAGEVGPVTMTPLETPDTLRLSFHFSPGGAQSADLRLDWQQTGVPVANPLAETWIFRWTP